MSVYPGVIPGVGYRPIPPEPAAYPFTRMQIDWLGWNGETFDLSRPGSGTFITTDGFDGLSWPPFEFGTSTSGSRGGRRRRSARATERSASIPVYIFGDANTEQFLERYSRWQHSWHPLKPGRLRVTTPLGYRDLWLYFNADAQGSITRDPLYSGYMRCKMDVTAEDQPYWLDPAVTLSFSSGSPEPLFGADGELHIASGGGFASATVDNPGDVSDWPVYKITNTEPTQGISATIGLAGGTFTTPTINAGQSLTINTDTNSCRLSTGVDVAGQVRPYDPQPIPPGAVDLPLTLSMTGFGTVEVTTRAKYWRAFG